MRVTQCDVCGKTYEPYSGIKTKFGDTNGLLLVSFDSKGRYDKRGYFDLCPECSTKMVNFLKITEIEEPNLFTVAAEEEPLNEVD